MFLRGLGLGCLVALAAGCVPVKHAPVIVPVSVAIRTRPDFPIQAIREAHQGTVVVLVLVDANGKVGQAWIRKSSGYRELDRAALVCVRQWQFRPRMVDGTPVVGYAAVPLHFGLGNQGKKFMNAKGDGVR